jgi:hypothetical protein
LGLFQSDKENDQLKEALRNPEHIGLIRGVGSQMSWKHGFLKDSTSYKKHDRYKKTLEEKIEDKVTRSLRTGLWHSYKILANNMVHHSSIS